MEIVIPYAPRIQFRPYHDRRQRFACIVAHRRAGKTVAAINDLIRDTLTCPNPAPRAAYIAPYYRQAKAVAWDYAKEFSLAIPGVAVNESELRIDYPNGGRLRLFGADNYDAMRGIYLDAVVMDEPADFPEGAWPTVIRPALSDRAGRATFIGTPKGKNEFWETWRLAGQSPDWFSVMLKASETGILEAAELDAALRDMGPDRYAQEFECSFEAAIVGAYYGAEMADAEREGRIGRVPHEPHLPVVTAWDLGIGDSTAIWFAQFVGAEKRLIDYYEANGVGLDHYAGVLRARGYQYAEHVLPHDAEVGELGTGKRRVDVLRGLGLTNITIAPRLPVDDGIQAARAMLRGSWFDAAKCDRGVEALRQYRRDYDERLRTFRARPLHDWCSHGADAFRYLATGYRPVAAAPAQRRQRNPWAA